MLFGAMQGLHAGRALGHALVAGKKGLHRDGSHARGSERGAQSVVRPQRQVACVWWIGWRTAPCSIGSRDGNAPMTLRLPEVNMRCTPLLMSNSLICCMLDSAATRPHALFAPAWRSRVAARLSPSLRTIVCVADNEEERASLGQYSRLGQGRGTSKSTTT